MEAAYNALFTTMGLLFIWYLTCFLFQEHLVDSYRQQLFQLRDQLFDYAAAGNISFDSPAYRSVRRVMNKLIRYAHQTSLSRSILGYLFFNKKDDVEVLRTALNRALEPIQAIEDTEVRAKLQEFHWKAITCMVLFVLKRSPLVWYLVPVMIALWPLAKIVNWWMKVVPGLRDLESQALSAEV